MSAIFTTTEQFVLFSKQSDFREKYYLQKLSQYATSNVDNTLWDNLQDTIKNNFLMNAFET